MDDTVFVALIVAIGSLASSVLIAWTTGHRERKRSQAETKRQNTAAKDRRAERQEDWDRQDEVARRAEVAAEKVSEVAEQTARTAALLVEQNAALTKAAEKAAMDLIEANDRLARETIRAAALVNGKLDQIHTLVNSNLLEAMKATLDMTDALVIALQAAPDKSPEAEERIRILQGNAIEMRAQLADRRRQTLVAEATLEQGASGAVKAEWEPDE